MKVDQEAEHVCPGWGLVYKAVSSRQPEECRGASEPLMVVSVCLLHSSELLRVRGCVLAILLSSSGQLHNVSLEGHSAHQWPWLEFNPLEEK